MDGSRLLATPVAVAFAAAVVLAGPLGGAAGAAVCGPGAGVSVVVDGRGAGGALSAACDADGGGQTGDVIVPRAGYPLEYVQRQPGFVCRVGGVPAADPCVDTPPADAYWGLYWSDGKSGTWSYASTGITGLRIPEGGSIGLAWQDGSGRTAPGLDPAPGAALPEDDRAPQPVEDASAPGDGQGDGGLPWLVWLVPLGVLVVLAAGAAVRRRGSGAA